MEKERDYRYYEIVLNVRNIVERINIDGICFPSYPLADHTTFKVGGPAELCIRPRSITELNTVVKELRALDVTPLIIGGGANVVISQNGIRGVVIITDLLTGMEAKGAVITSIAGSPVSDVADFAAGLSLSGMEFIYKMPGTVGGAVWMNARCYGSSIADIVDTIEYINEYGDVKQILPADCAFEYKKSIFQQRNWIITKVSFSLKRGEEKSIRSIMTANADDRKAKGHFTYPCAGSAFKNNREFGRPTGQIIDSLGLKGLQVGGAQVAPFHGNIIINTGNATGEDIFALVSQVRTEVLSATGFDLDPEILFLGF